MYRKIVCFCVAMCVLLPLIGGIMTENFTVNAEGTMAVTSVDGVNVTRWADMLIVYKDIATTGQNEWGYNVVVDSSGVVTQIIEGGDIRGKDLAVPSGGMVVSATGARVDWLKENIKAGDYVCFDDVTCRIMVSEKNEFDISFVQSLGITHFNEPRYSGRVVVYDVSGTTTQTNGYGYEIVVSAEGVIIGSGGNDNTVPQGGYVVSAIEPADKTLLKTCGVVGAQCLLDRDSMKVTIVYDEESILRWAQMRIDTIRSLLGQAKENLQLIDYEKAEEAISKAEEFMNTNDITTYAGRSELSMMFDEAQLLLYESKGVELRAVWYSPLERNESGVKEVVQTLADNGINQLCLGVSNGRDTIIPLPDNFYDDYEGRQAAAAQEMSIFKDMDLVYDLKMADKENEIHTTTGLEEVGRHMYDTMTPEEKKAWDAHYDPIIQKFKKANLSGKALAEWKYQQYMRDYLRVIHSVDRNIGRVLDYLEKAGLLENTMIVYTSDQGFYMGEHGWFDKRFMYEESFRTPLLVRLPGGIHGDVDAFVQNIDYAPTILELAGVEIPKDMHGESFLPFLKGEKPAHWRDALYYHFYEYPAEHAVKRHYGVRTDRYKLIHFYNDIDTWELYDLQEDPSEMKNLYGQPGYEEITRQLEKKLVELQQQYQDTTALALNHF